MTTETKTETETPKKDLLNISFRSWHQNSKLKGDVKYVLRDKLDESAFAAGNSTIERTKDVANANKYSGHYLMNTCWNWEHFWVPVPAAQAKPEKKPETPKAQPRAETAKKSEPPKKPTVTLGKKKNASVRGRVR